MILAIVLSGIGGAFGYVAPMIIQRALDIAVPDKNMRLLFSLVAAGTSVSVLRRQTAWKDTDPGGQLCQFGIGYVVKRTDQYRAGSI